jgi:NADPH:quinone reductase-like Zn-dependent oxidoreductase
VRHVRAVVISRHGGPEVLKVEERPDPRPGPGEVRIDVAASGINFADVMARMGLYPDAPKTPCVVGYEVAGSVAEVGDGVTGASAGDRVMAGTEFGGYSSQVVVPVDQIIPLPDNLSFEQGAAVPVQYATAWAAIVGYGSVRQGERVLIHSAGGGVGIAATQIAKRHGAEVWGTASPGKHEAIRSFGVDHPVDYRVEGWERDLPSFDIVMDAIGGKSFRRSYDMLRAGGRLVAFGASSVVSGEKRNVVKALRAVASMPRFNLMKQMSSSKAVIGLNMLTLWKEHGTLDPWIGPLAEMLADGSLQPVVAGAFPFDRAGEAHNMLTERRNVGKVVLVP